MLEHLEHLSSTAATAISNIKFDKVVVWDGGNGTGGTSGFLQSLAKSLPPMLHIMRDVAGVQMPEFFGKLEADGKDASPPSRIDPHVDLTGDKGPTRQ